MVLANILCKKLLNVKNAVVTRHLSAATRSGEPLRTEEPLRLRFPRPSQTINAKGEAIRCKYGEHNIEYVNVMTDYISDMEYMRYESVGEYYITG